MKDKNKHDNKGRIALLILIILPAIAAVIYLKSSVATDRKPDVSTDAKAQQVRVAVPDTTVATEELPIVQSGSTPGERDSTQVTRDLRSAAEAGAEDGYWDGYYDGAEGSTQRRRYDEGCNFTTQYAREAYATNYREGYETGYAEAHGE